MVCVTVMLRKQWMEKERLIYPMVQVPMAMIEEERPARRKQLERWRTQTRLRRISPTL